MTTFIVDNSIWQKANGSEAIAKRLREVATQHLIMTCPPQVLEYCHSARNPVEYEVLREDMSHFLKAERHPSEHQALDIQEALWRAGRVRAAGAMDCLIAAYAIVNDAVILNSDRDFGYLELAIAGLIRQEFVAA